MKKSLLCQKENLSETDEVQKVWKQFIQLIFGSEKYEET